MTSLAHTMKEIKIFGINGSIRSGSSSHIVMNELKSNFLLQASFDTFDQLATIPAFDGSEVDPAAVHDFKAKLKQADGVVIVTPEYAFGVPGALKNLLDWTVGSGDFVNKPVALITASSLGEKGHESLQHTLTAISARILPETTLLISFIRAKIKDGKINDIDTKVALTNLVDAFVRSIF